MATPSPEEIDAFMHMKDAGTDSRVPLILAIEIPLVVIMVGVVCLRFYARSRISAAVGKDDWTMGIATMIAVANTIITCVATRYGAGIHAWNILFEWIEPGAMLGWIYGLLFIPSVFLTKISICLTYLRIFPGRKDRIFCYGMITYQILAGIGIFLATMLQCLPINSYWDLSIKDKKCYNQELASQVTSALNSVSDFAVFLWPAANIWKIQLPVKQRLALMLVFTLGVVVCVAGVIRIWYYTVYFKSKDVFWSAGVLYVVSDIECNVGIICGSLPEIRPLLSRWWTNTASTAGNLTSRSRSRSRSTRRPYGRPTISAPMASPYVIQRVDSQESRLEPIPGSTESFIAGKGYQTSYQRLSKTGNIMTTTPTSPYAIRYDEKGAIHMQEYPSPNPNGHYQTQQTNQHLQNQIYEYPSPISQSPETLRSPIQQHVESERETLRPLQSAMSNHRRISRPETRGSDRHRVSTLSEDLGSMEMWVGVERPMGVKPTGAI